MPNWQPERSRQWKKKKATRRQPKIHTANRERPLHKPPICQKKEKRQKRNKPRRGDRAKRGAETDNGSQIEKAKGDSDEDLHAL